MRQCFVNFSMGCCPNYKRCVNLLPYKRPKLNEKHQSVFVKIELKRTVSKLFTLYQLQTFHTKNLEKSHEYWNTVDGQKLMENSPGGGGVHNMLRVRVCAAHMGGFLGPKFSRQGSLFRQIFLKQGWVIQKFAKNSKKWVVFRQNSS